MLDEVCSWSNFSSNIFWFMQPDFHVGWIWVQSHPTFGSLSLGWVQNISGGVRFRPFYWHSNVNNLQRATKNQKKRRSQTRQERRRKNGDQEQKGFKCKKRLDLQWDSLASRHLNPSNPATLQVWLCPSFWIMEWMDFWTFEL